MLEEMVAQPLAELAQICVGGGKRIDRGCGLGVVVSAGRVDRAIGMTLVGGRKTGLSVTEDSDTSAARSA
jgi:hypothetical protein